MLAIVLLVLPTWLLFHAARRPGAFARPEFYLFLSVYAYGTAGYLGYMFLQLERARFLQTIQYERSTILLAYGYTIVAMVSIYFGGRLYREVRINVCQPRRSHFLIIGVSAALFAILVNVQYFASVGAFSGVSHNDVVDGKAKGIFFPYFYLMVAAISLVAYCEGGKKYSWMLLGLFAILNLSVGSRRHALAVLIAVISAKYLVGRPFSKRKLVVILVLAVVIGVLIGATRGNVKVSQIELQNLLLVFTEFVRANASLLYYMKFDIEPLYGETIIDGILRVVPGFMAPYSKPEALATQFKDLFGGLVGSQDRSTGLGFSPVAEVMINFSWLSIAPIFYAFTAILRHLSNYLRCSVWAMVNPILCVAMFNVGRGGFQPILNFMFYTLLFFLILVFSAQILRGQMWCSRAR